MTITEFARRVERAQKDSLVRAKLSCSANMKNAETSIKPGRKWTKVNVGLSGKFMIDPDGRIFGIKAYGVPHYGKYYGTLENPYPQCFVGSWG